ncbi:hypothetical protein JW796_04695 [Candidatus Dojkabacteria bacterium]|nr:hypothetical protein [Candidatus Dojkabacteria bacterium]
MRKIFLQVLAVLSLTVVALILPESAQAAENCNSPGYGSSACYCPSNYPVYTMTLSGNRYCCSSGYTLDVRLSGVWCISGGNQEEPVNAAVLPGGVRGLCQKEGSYLVEIALEKNYCISPGEQVGAGDGAYEGKYFLGCKSSTPAKSLTKTGGEIVNLLGYCRNDDGIFVESTDYNNGVCTCGNGDIFPQADLAGQTCQDKCGVAGVVFNNTEIAVSACDKDPACVKCRDSGYTYTALGCIDTSRSGLITWLIRLSIIVVMVAIIFRFIQASFLIRSGDPEKIKEGKEIITSAVIALVLILISVPLLDFIGVRVLGIFPKGFITSSGN